MSNFYHNAVFRRWLFVVFAAAALVAFWKVVVTLFLAATVASVAFPLKERLRRILRKPQSNTANTLASTITTLLVLFALSAIVAALVLLFILHADDLKQIAVSFADKVSHWLATLLPQRPALSDYAVKTISTAASYLYPILTKAGLALVHLLLFVIALFAFLLRGDSILASLISLLPKQTEIFKRLLQRAYDTLYAIYFAHLLTALATFVLALPFFALLGFSHLLFWATLCAFFQLVPFLGPTLIMLALSVWSFVEGNPTNGVLMLAVGYPVVCAFPDVVLRPLLMRRHAKVNTFLLWLGFIGGLLSMGPVGFVAGPLLLVVVAETLRIAGDKTAARGSTPPSPPPVRSNGECQRG